MGEQILLRAFGLSTDQVPRGPAFLAGLWGVPVQEWLVHRARRRGMAGATVLRGMAGFGRRGVVPLAGWHVAHHMPLVVEIVDTAAAIAAFCREEVAGHLAHGTVTLERAGVLRYRHREARETAAPLAMLGRVQELSTLPDLSGSDAMQTTDAILLRIFAGDSDMHGGRPLHEAIVLKARERGLSGATVFRGAMGFGAHSVLHTAKVMELSTDLPIVIEIVDSEEKVRGLLPEIDGMIGEGLVTMESVRVVGRKG